MNKKPSATRIRRKRSKRNAAQPLIRSNILPNLREAIEAIDQLKQLIGAVASFHIVVDANILISDVLWLASKRRKTFAQTSLQECIVAGTIIAYVTPAVAQEVEEKLALLATKRGWSGDAWASIWSDYKLVLKITEPDQERIEQYAFGQDPDDAPTLALADMLAASGILTRDSDIAAMGGNTIPVGFVLQARDYSRKAAVSVSIQVGGYYLVVGTSEAFHFLARAMKQCGAWFRAQPPAIKLGVFLILVLSIVRPRSRNALMAAVKAFGGNLPEVLLQLVQVTIALVRMAADNRAVPPVVPATASFAARQCGV